MKTFTLAAFAVVAFGLLAAGCSGGSKDFCQSKQVHCDAPLACDPDDGVCKCGGKGGVVCPQGFACDARTNTCLSSLCANVVCEHGLACDVFDGQCKCGGTGGPTCQANETCNAVTKTCSAPKDCSQVACPVNQTCDAATLQCVCGNASCAEGQSCSVNTDSQLLCAQDVCSGVTCLGNTSCDPADGYCKCNGVVCQSGSVCSCPGGNCDGGTPSCQTSNACASVTCQGGATCDPSDGHCKCGGPGGPTCGQNQICASGPPAQCQGGNQCVLTDGGVKSCGGGTSCDPEDGLCKCGGQGGQLCSSGADGGVAEVCVLTTFSESCRQTCDPRLQDCPSGKYCFFDTTATTPVAYCATPTDTRQAGSSCGSPTACFTTNPTPKGLLCSGLTQGGTGFCRSYCDSSQGDLSCAQVPRPQKCVQLQGAQSGVGFCDPQ